MGPTDLLNLTLLDETQAERFLEVPTTRVARKSETRARSESSAAIFLLPRVARFSAAPPFSSQGGTRGTYLVCVRVSVYLRDKHERIDGL